MGAGLVMEGGAMRGMFTCGVIDVLMENGITFPAAAGVSAGAVFGCNIKSRQIGRGIRYNKLFCGDARYAGIKSLLTTGDLYNVDFCYHTVPDEIDVFDRGAFADNPMVFYVGATDVCTGKPVYHRCTDGGANDIQWMRASASMPLVSKIVELDGYKLLDGGIADPVPFAFMEEQGYERNVVILTQPLGYVKKPYRVMPLVRASLSAYPEMVRCMGERHIHYNAQTEEIARQEKSGQLFVIRPPRALKLPPIPKDPEALEEAYQLGRREAKGCLPALERFLQSA